MQMDFARRFVAILLTVLTVTACSKKRSSYQTFEKASDDCMSDAAPNRYIVQYFDGTMEVVEAASKEKFIEGFLSENLDRIAYAEHDFVVRERTVKTKDFETSADNWGAERIMAEDLWQQGIYGEGVTVAVVDTGMDINHTQLRNRVAVNDGEQGTDKNGNDKASNNIDDDENGFVDDVHGVNFLGNSPLRGDNQYHGTHVAGIIAAEHGDVSAGNKSYVQGVAPKAKILPLAFLDQNGAGMMADGVRALKYAMAQKARVVNASWGGVGCSRSLKEVVGTMNSRGVIFVAAAGNESKNIDRSPSYPASLGATAQITVGSVGEFDFMAEHSNFGRKHVHIFAPGELIVSTFPHNEMVSLTGTSMATPFVAGAIALLLSAEPTASVKQIRESLYRSATHRAEYVNASKGRLNMANALQELRDLIGAGTP